MPTARFAFAILSACVLGGCIDRHESLKDASISSGPTGTTGNRQALRSDDLALRKVAHSHAVKNGHAQWQNPATGSHGFIKTGKAVQIGKSWCFQVTSTTYASGAENTQSTEFCNPPLPSPGKA